MAPSPPPDPAGFLAGIIQTLLQRAHQAPDARPERLGRLLVAETPDAADLILDRPGLFAKNFSLVAAFGPSRFNLNGPDWEAMRPRTQRAYARAGRPVAEPGIAAIYGDELSRAEATAAGIERALSRAALRVFFAAFGLIPDVTPFLGHFARLRRIAARLQYLSWDGSDTAQLAQVAAEAALARDAWTDAAEAQPEVLALATRLAAEAPAVPRMSMLADLMTNMFAGIETTTAALGWMIDCLGRNEALQAALADQARAGGGPLLGSFRNECLRVFPPIPFVVREATGPVLLGPHRLAAGSLVMLSLIGLHRHPKSFADPLGFHAARAEFAPDAPPNPAFRPFLTGPRACGGRRIAEMELDAGLRALIARFHFQSPAGDPAFDYALAFRPRLTAAYRVVPR